MVYLDLAEVDQVLALSRLWGRSAWCPARFKRDDYLKRGELDLDQSVRACVLEQTGTRPSGPIRMLTHLRYYGTIFNPVTFYYCFDDAGERVVFIVAEITNTPWKERHAYVLSAAAARRSSGQHQVLRWRFGKEFHVSPFMPMGMEYDWSFDAPGESLLVHMNLRHRESDIPPAKTRAFDATLHLQRRELSASSMRWMLIRFPLLTLRVLARIHFEALRLWIKRAAVHPHPRSRSGRSPAAPVHGASAR